MPERFLASERETTLLGDDLAAALRPGDMLALSGDLGAGKTTLARAIIRALANDEALEVPSPTFTLVQAYETRLPVHHFDLYRLSAAEELDELGLSDALREGVAIVEWPEKAEGRLGVAPIRVSLAEDGDGRRATIEAGETALARIERSLAIRDFLDRSGMAGATRRHLTGDASSRAYETAALPGGEALVVMNAPRQPDGPPIRDGKPYSQIAHLAESVAPFVAVGRLLRGQGFRTPQIHAADLDRGLLLIEHLGTGAIAERGAPDAPRYEAAARVLAAIHECRWPGEAEAGPGVVHAIPPYDRAAMAIETELLTDWFMPHRGTAGPTTNDLDRFRAIWNGLFDRLQQAEHSIVLRDYHSPNLIWREAAEGHDRVGIIDFQDALIGPAAYDVASLAMDARVTVEPALERAVVEAYCAHRSAGFDRAGFDEAYAIMAAQRNTKIAGIFVRLHVRDGKPHYLGHLPRIGDYLARALAHPALSELGALYRQWGVLDGLAR